MFLLLFVSVARALLEDPGFLFLVLQFQHGGPVYCFLFSYNLSFLVSSGGPLLVGFLLSVFVLGYGERAIH